MKKLIKEHKKYLDVILSDLQYAKLIGDPLPGSKIKIRWKEYRFIDEGYLFALPISEDEDDLFFHIPTPDSSEDGDTAPPLWGHIKDLLTNGMIISVKCTGGFKNL